MTEKNKDFFLCELLLKNEKEKANSVYLKQPYKRQWFELTWSETIKKARRVAAFLLNNGYKRGDHIAIISKNCAEWLIADFGIALAGMVSVPLFSNQNQDNIEYILDHGEIKLVFVGKLDHHQRIRGYIPPKYPTVNFGYHDDLDTDHHWNDLMTVEPLTQIVRPEPNDLYTIIYSSGTSGTPKGAMYDHQRIANYLALYAEDIKRISDLDHYRLISYLPLAHVYERSAIQLGSIVISSTVYFVESLDLFADNLRDAKPTLFAAVPRIWGVFQQKIEQKLSPKVLQFLLYIPFVSSYIKNKIRHELGLSECTNCFSGASQLPIEISTFFERLGIIIQEGYGQTENMAYATFSELDNNRKGYVGSPRLGVYIKKGDENELLMKSDCLMNGYFKQEEASKKSFTKDGWLKTGDIVEIDSQERVKILGRLSEVFKNQKGEFIHPTPIEKNFSEDGYIDYLCLIGQGLPVNVMVVNLSDDGKKASRELVTQALKRRMKKVNSELQSYEKIGHVLVITDEWTTDNNLITPTLKIKRRVVAEKYESLIKKALDENQSVIWQTN